MIPLSDDLAKPFDLVKRPNVNPLSGQTPASTVPAATPPAVPPQVAALTLPPTSSFGRNPLMQQRMVESGASSFGKDVFAGADKAAQANPEAAAKPGGWARSLLAGVSTALSGLQDVSTKEGGSILSGVTETIANRANRLKSEKQDADKAAQLAKENERADKQLNLETQKADDLHAYSQVQTLALERSIRNADQTFQKEASADGREIANTLRQSGHEELSPAAGIPESEFEANFGTGKKYDPDKFRAVNIGTTTVDKGGKKTEEPVWAIFARTAKPVTVSEGDATIFKNSPTPFTAGSTIDGDVYYNAITTARQAKATQQAIDAANDKFDVEHATADKTRMNAADLAAVNPFIGGTHDTIQAIETLTGQKSKDGKPTAPALAASRLLTNYFKQDDLEQHRHDLAAEAILRDQDALKKAAESKYKGDPNALDAPLQQSGPLAGLNTTYLATLPKDDQSVMLTAATGRMPIANLAYLLGRQPEFANALANVAPNIDLNAAKEFPNLYKNFTSGNYAQALNSGGTAMKHLKELYDASGFWAGRWYDPKGAAQRETIISYLAPEMAKFTKGGQGGATVEETAHMRELLSNVIARKTPIQEAARLMFDKLDEYRTTWDNGLPSPNYRDRMPWISDRAVDDLMFVLNDGKKGSEVDIARGHGATQTAPGSDGRMHYVDDRGRDYGLVTPQQQPQQNAAPMGGGM